MSRINSKNNENMIMWIIIAVGIIVATLVTIFIINIVNIDKSNKSQIEEYISEINEQYNEEDNSNNNYDELEEVTVDLGKKINNTETENSIQEEENKNSKNNDNKKVDDVNSDKNKKNENTVLEVENKKEVQNEPKFLSPIKGEVLRKFAKDSLVYSNTLEEWITHNGIDIKADKTSIVSSAENGTVYAIKNDPRYGLTVIINHDNGYKTVYANLLTAEFIVEGEQVESGQTIGTVGNTAPFEIADEYHLHFEIIKDGEYVDPLNYIDL